MIHFLFFFFIYKRERCIIRKIKACYQLCAALILTCGLFTEKLPPCILTNSLHRSICRAPISPVTTQHQSAVLWQSHFQGHSIAVLDMAQAISVTTGQTGTASAVIYLYEHRGKREKETCSFTSHCIIFPGYKNLALNSDILRCGNFNLVGSTVW